VDFEIYAATEGGDPIVGVSNDPTYTNLDSKNKLLFGKVLENLVSWAFMAPSPNPGDPLFVHLRIKTNSQALYKKIAMLWDHHIVGDRKYKGQISPKTPIQDLFGKMILVIDRGAAPDYNKYPVCPKDDVVANSPCFNLQNFVNLESGGYYFQIFSAPQLMTHPHTPPQIGEKENELKSNALILKGVTPAPTMTGLMSLGNFINPNAAELITQYMVQIVMCRFDIRDTNLESYETIFSKAGSAFVPIVTKIKI
jgi:hypothetical protein